MKKYFYLILGLSFTGILIYSFSKVNNKQKLVEEMAATKSLYDLSIKTLDGSKTIKFSDFKGKKILCVNVASECGYTPQYKGLQALSEQYKDKLVVIGFPCNQFGGQEPGSSEEISTFCKKNYGVTFLLTEKVDVKGSTQHAVYQWLTQKQLNGVSDATIKWNFNKILVNEKGEWQAYFPSSVAPNDPELTGKL